MESSSLANLWILIATPRSPFARRIRIALSSRGVPHEVQMTDVFQPSPALLTANPLGLVPVLFCPDTQEWVPDSDTILDILDESPLLAKASAQPVWPIHTQARAPVRTRSRWSTGLMTATVAHFLERARAGGADAEVLSEHEAALQRTLEKIGPDLVDHPHLYWPTGASLPTQAGWDLAVALEYLDLRLPSLPWRGGSRSAAAFLSRVAELKVFQETRPPLS